MTDHQVGPPVPPLGFEQLAELFQAAAGARRAAREAVTKAEAALDATRAAQASAEADLQTAQAALLAAIRTETDDDA